MVQGTGGMVGLGWGGAVGGELGVEIDGDLCGGVVVDGPEADVDAWREQFQAPDAAELDGGEIPAPPPGWQGWSEWAVDHWPSCTDS